jgi:high-affinity nickel permease
MIIDLLSFTVFAILVGFRHGMDSDHVAAIADMVGAERRRTRQIKLGVMYALGHGAIVLVIGLLAVLLGSRLPEQFLIAMEMLVGLSLLVLGGFILYSVFTRQQNYEYQSRWELVYRMIARIFKKDESKLDLQKIGIFGAFAIGVIHGIGAETPTQVAIISSSVGLDNLVFACLQIVLFTVGLLAATVLVTYIASWGFMKAQLRQKFYLLLGCVTGGYSMLLGFFILQGM